MTTLHEAAQQALEAWNTGDLRVLGPAMGALRADLAQEQAEPVVGWMDPESGDVVSAAQRVVWAQDFGVAGRRKAGRFTIPLRAALAQEQAGCETEDDCTSMPWCRVRGGCQRKQAEPVTGLDMFLDPQDGLKPKRYKPKAEPVQEQAEPVQEPAQEPVAKCIDDICSEHLGRVETFDHLPKGTLLYTIFPRRTMVPLTEAEIVEAVREADLDWQAGWTLDEHAPNRFDALARAIEKASWEKNHG